MCIYKRVIHFRTFLLDNIRHTDKLNITMSVTYIFTFVVPTEIPLTKKSQWYTTDYHLFGIFCKGLLLLSAIVSVIPHSNCEEQIANTLSQLQAFHIRRLVSGECLYGFRLISYVHTDIG